MNVLPATWHQAFLEFSVNDTRGTKMSAPANMRLSSIAWNRIGGASLLGKQWSPMPGPLDVAGRMTMKRRKKAGEMKRNITGRIAITAIGGLTALLLSVSPAQAKEAAGDWYGPYSTQGICEYWRNGVQAGGTQTYPCFYDQGWYFWAAA